MIIEAIDEFNADGHLIYAGNFPGAFVRGKTRDEALNKFQAEIQQYTRWMGKRFLCAEPFSIKIIEEKEGALKICDADSDILFASEKQPLTKAEYVTLKALAMKSAKDFQQLYDSIPDKTHTILKPRRTFHGAVPITAEEMYSHTKNVNSYYWGEIGIAATNEPDIVQCRSMGFQALEASQGYLLNPVFDGSYEEQWTLRKVCRRFIWHDRIHGKAMYRMAVHLCEKEHILNPFYFQI